MTAREQILWLYIHTLCRPKQSKHLVQKQKPLAGDVRNRFQNTHWVKLARQQKCSKREQWNTKRFVKFDIDKVTKIVEDGNSTHLHLTLIRESNPRLNNSRHKLQWPIKYRGTGFLFVFFAQEQISKSQITCDVFLEVLGTCTLRFDGQDPFNVPFSVKMKENQSEGRCFQQYGKLRVTYTRKCCDLLLCAHSCMCWCAIKKTNEKGSRLQKETFHHCR